VARAIADREKELGLPLSGGVDRDTLNRPKMQVGFFTFMVQPMYETLDILLPLTEQIGAVQALNDHFKAQLKPA
jgi:hypothetical protein